MLTLMATTTPTWTTCPPAPPPPWRVRGGGRGQCYSAAWWLAPGRQDASPCSSREGGGGRAAALPPPAATWASYTPLGGPPAGALPKPVVNAIMDGDDNDMDGALPDVACWIAPCPYARPAPPADCAPAPGLRILPPVPAPAGCRRPAHHMRSASRVQTAPGTTERWPQPVHRTERPSQMAAPMKTNQFCDSVLSTAHKCCFCDRLPRRACTRRRYWLGRACSVAARRRPHPTLCQVEWV